MAFSQEWEERYQETTHMSVWPWSDLVSMVMRHARPDKPDYKVLELGCGAGANIPFFQWLGVDYYAVEGSSTIVKMLEEKFPWTREKIIMGDFTKEIPFTFGFDLIVDRAAMTHNDTIAIRNCLSMVYEKLKPGGKYIGIDWFSTVHSEYHNGLSGEDIHTRKDFTEGQFAGVGRVHFSDQEHLQDLFGSFSIQLMEHKVVSKSVPDDRQVLASWNLMAVKPVNR